MLDNAISARLFVGPYWSGWPYDLLETGCKVPVVEAQGEQCVFARSGAFGSLFVVPVKRRFRRSSYKTCGSVAPLPEFHENHDFEAFLLSSFRSVIYRQSISSDKPYEKFMIPTQACLQSLYAL